MLLNMGSDDPAGLSRCYPAGRHAIGQVVRNHLAVLLPNEPHIIPQPHFLNPHPRSEAVREQHTWVVKAWLLPSLWAEPLGHPTQDLLVCLCALKSPHHPLLEYV